MPRPNAELYRTVGCELLRTEVALLEQLALKRRITVSELVRLLVREHLNTNLGISPHTPETEEEKT